MPHLHARLDALSIFPSVVVNTEIVKDSIVLGFSGKPLELLNIAKVKKDNLQVIRRYTGGGTVVVDHSTVFASLVLNVSTFLTLKTTYLR